MSSPLIALSASLVTRFGRLKTSLRSSYWAGMIGQSGGEVRDGFVVREGSRFSLSAGSKVEIGKGVTLAEDVHVFVGPNATLTLGQGVFIGRGSTVVANESVHIGSGTQIAHGVTIIDSDHRFEDSSQPLVEQGGVTKPILIGENCWLGAGVIVLKGISIGNRAVIGAGSVVTDSVPESSVAVGNPARVRRALIP